MTATNHALTGAVIGLVVTNPLMALPVAFLSHFALDMVPHYGPATSNIGSKRFRNYLVSDGLLCILLVVVLAVSHPLNWLLAAACAFVATTPDFMWVKNFMHEQRGKIAPHISKRSPVVRFHHDIQWFQRPIGAFVEAAWFIAAISVLAALTRA